MRRLALAWLLCLPAARAAEAHPHMADDPLVWMLEVEELEHRRDGGAGDLHWDVVGWIGYDDNRLALRSEGERETGGPAENQLELLWWRPLSAWWDLVAGARYDSGPLDDRAYLAVGVQGLAPQWLHVEATGYLGDRGDWGVRLQADYDWLFTQRLVLAARAEGEWWSDSDDRLARGSGESAATLGLRLRYEIRREFAPYLGLEWKRSLGDSADLVRAAGDDVDSHRWVAGVGFWF